METNLITCKKTKESPSLVLLQGASNKCVRLAQLLNSQHGMDKDPMSPERMELFWAFLDLEKFDNALKCIDSDFQCHALHPKKHTTLLVEAVARGMCLPLAEQKQCLELMKALRVRGASWTQTCKSTHSYSIWMGPDPNTAVQYTVDYGSNSALSFTQAWIQQLTDKKDWRQEVSYLHLVLESFIAEPKPSRTKLAIDADIVSQLRRSQRFVFLFLSCKLPT